MLCIKYHIFELALRLLSNVPCFFQSRLFAACVSAVKVVNSFIHSLGAHCCVTPGRASCRFRTLYIARLERRNKNAGEEKLAGLQAQVHAMASLQLVIAVSSHTLHAAFSLSHCAFIGTYNIAGTYSCHPYRYRT